MSSTAAEYRQQEQESRHDEQEIRRNWTGEEWLGLESTRAPRYAPRVTMAMVQVEIAGQVVRMPRGTFSGNRAGHYTAR